MDLKLKILSLLFFFTISSNLCYSQQFLDYISVEDESTSESDDFIKNKQEELKQFIKRKKDLQELQDLYKDFSVLISTPKETKSKKIAEVDEKTDNDIEELKDEIIIQIKKKTESRIDENETGGILPNIDFMSGNIIPSIDFLGKPIDDKKFRIGLFTGNNINDGQNLNALYSIGASDYGLMMDGAFEIWKKVKTPFRYGIGFMAVFTSKSINTDSITSPIDFNYGDIKTSFNITYENNISMYVGFNIGLPLTNIEKVRQRIDFGYKDEKKKRDLTKSLQYYGNIGIRFQTALNKVNNDYRLAFDLNFLIMNKYIGTTLNKEKDIILPLLQISMVKKIKN